MMKKLTKKSKAFCPMLSACVAINWLALVRLAETRS
jgi:hypothetical protein